MPGETPLLGIVESGLKGIVAIATVTDMQLRQTSPRKADEPWDVSLVASLTKATISRTEVQSRSPYRMIETTSLSAGIWSRPTLWPAYFTLDPETRAYLAPSTNLGEIFLQTSRSVEPSGRISGFSKSGSPSGRFR